MGPGFGYYGYRGGMYSAWGGYDTEVSEYTVGTLNVDLVDAARKELVWEGTAVGRLRESDREEMAERVQSVIADVFAKHPLASPIDDRLLSRWPGHAGRSRSDRCAMRVWDEGGA